jgi:hypothetical protein
MKHNRTELARMAAAIDSPEGRIYFAGDSANWGVGAAMVHVSHVTTALWARYQGHKIGEIANKLRG